MNNFDFHAYNVNDIAFLYDICNIFCHTIYMYYIILDNHFHCSLFFFQYGRALQRAHSRSSMTR
jgi:hypothetical protein